jgi:callose synthase
MWWNEENAFYRKLPLTSKMLFIIRAALYVLVGEGIRQSDLFRSDFSLGTPMIRIGVLVPVLVGVFILGRIFSANERMMPYPVRRTIGILVFIILLAGVITLFIEDMNYLRYALAAYYEFGAVCLLGLLWGFKFVKYFYFIHDVICGHIIFIPLFFFAALQLPGHIQTWLLYHNALSTNVVVSDILRYARKTKDAGGGQANEDLVEQVAELRKLVQKQEQILTGAGLAPGSAMPVGEQTPYPEDSAAPEPRPARAQPTGGRSYGRAISMSGMDVWGDMALGDLGDLTKSQISSGPTESSQSTSSVSHSGVQGFSFSQPDTMPPR